MADCDNCTPTEYTVINPVVDPPIGGCHTCGVALHSVSEDVDTPPNFPVIGDNGNWYINGADTGEPSRGADGEDGVDGYTPTIGLNGNWFINGLDTEQPAYYIPSDGEDGEDGVAGDPGADGVTPHIGENGNWFIGGVDTEQPSRGPSGLDGLTPEIGPNYNWWVDGVDTGLPAKGSDGEDGDNGSDATVILTTEEIQLPILDTFKAIIATGQDVNSDVETALLLTQLSITDGFTHADDTATFTAVEDFDYVVVTANIVYTGSAVNISPILKLLRGTTLVAQSATAVQSGAATNVTSTNLISFYDINVPSGTLYTLVAIAGSTVLNSTTYTLSSVTAVGYRTVGKEVVIGQE